MPKIMSHFIARLSAYLTLFLFAASCTSHETGLSVPGGEVYFSASVNKTKCMTRMADNTWENNDAIGVFMLSAGGTIPDGILSPDGRMADNRRYVLAETGFIPAQYGDRIFYPNDGSSVDFAAYYPHNPAGTEGLADYIYPVDLTDQSDPAAIDFLFASSTNISNGSNAVPLVFTHQLSKLVLTVKKGPGMEETDMSDMFVVLKGAPVKAGFSLPSLSFIDLESSEVRARTISGGYVYELILVPHEETEGRVIEFVSGSDTFIWSIPAAAGFISGKSHPWTITINKRGITATPGNIASWEGNDSPPVKGSTGSSLKYKVGDYWPDPDAVYVGGSLQSGQAAEGVVFWLDPDAEEYDRDTDPENPAGVHGKIVSLIETAGLSWGRANTDESLDIAGIRSTDDGYTASCNMISTRSGGDNFASDYPAFNCIYQQNGDLQGDWYLPAANELIILRNAWNGGAGAGEIDRKAFNAVITSAGGAAVTKGTYWTSTELSPTFAACINFDRGVVNTFIPKSGYLAYVRAIRKF